MIKIIKDGKKPIKTKRVYKTTCWTCKCEFEFDEEDCTIIREKRLEGYTYIEVKCPCCGEIIKGQEDGPAFTYKDRIVDEKPYDIMTDENTWKRHPEQDLVYRPYLLEQFEKEIAKIKNKDYDVIYTDHINNDDMYLNIHNDEYDHKTNFNWNPHTNLPDDVDNTISRINSIDNYKLPDDYKIEDFKK